MPISRVITRNPEFNIGDYVTYWPDDQGFNMVVIGVSGGDYQLIEEPEGKPLDQHFQVSCTATDILQSALFKNRIEPTIFVVKRNA